MLGRAVARGLQFGGLSMPVKTHSFANGAYRPVTLIVAADQTWNRQSLDFDFGGAHRITVLPELHGWGKWPVGVDAVC